MSETEKNNVNENNLSGFSDVSKSEQLKDFADNFVIRCRLGGNEVLPISYGRGSVSYSGCSFVSSAGKIMYKGEKPIDTSITAAFKIDDMTAEKTFEVTVLSSDAGYISCYTRKTGDFQLYPEALSYSMHLAASTDGLTYSPLNNNTGVLFAAGYCTGDENMATKLLDKPYIFYTKEGSYAVIAQYLDAGTTPNQPVINYDNDHKGQISIYLSDDLVHFKREKFIKLSEKAFVKDAICEYDSSLNVYVIHWEDTDGHSYRTEITDICDESTIIKTEESNMLFFEKAAVGSEDAIIRNSIVVSKNNFDYIVRKLGRIVNTEINVPERTAVSSVEDVKKVTAEAVYSDGSKAIKSVIWDCSTVDFSKIGETYTINGKVLSGNSYGFAKALGKCATCYAYDAEGNNKILNSDKKKVDGVFDAVEHWADPEIFFWNGKYYFISTNDANGQIGVFLRESDTVEGLFADGVKAYEIISYDDEKNHTALFWAPELHNVEGKLCIFVALGLYSHVVVLEGDDPKKRDCWSDAHEVVYSQQVQKDEGVGKYFENRSMAIDMTYLRAGGKSYVIWSGREEVNGWGKGAFLYIATCDPEQPWVLTSKAVKINGAEYSWEQAHTVVAEGPFTVIHDGMIYLTYSGAATDNTYAVGLMFAREGDDLLDPSSWQKLNYPILNSFSVPGEYGTGHSSFLTLENGDVLLVYHARWHENYAPRTVGIRRVHFGFDGQPYLSMTEDEDVLPELRNVKTSIVIK